MDMNIRIPEYRRSRAAFLLPLLGEHDSKNSNETRCLEMVKTQDLRTLEDEPTCAAFVLEHHSPSTFITSNSNIAI